MTPIPHSRDFVETFFFFFFCCSPWKWRAHFISQSRFFLRIISRWLGRLFSFFFILFQPPRGSSTAIRWSPRRDFSVCVRTPPEKQIVVSPPLSFNYTTTTTTRTQRSLPSFFFLRFNFFLLLLSFFFLRVKEPLCPKRPTWTAQRRWMRVGGTCWWIPEERKKQKWPLDR